MDRVLPARQSWPFAANSTGRFLGSLNGRTLRRINCWEATGPARVEFAQSIQPKIITHLRENSDKLQESDNIVNLSLFMVGTSIQRTKPTIIFVSNDKATRREAYKLVKDSGILQDHPKFEIGHCPLVAEFEDFRQMGDPKIFGMDANLFALDTVPVDIFSNATYDLDGALLFALSADDVINYASAGGIVSFHGNQMVLTVNHFLPGTTVDRSVQRHPSNTTIEDDTEYEITGLEDPDGDDDDEELVSATSHGSLSPVLSVSDHENEDVSDTEASDSDRDQSRTVSSRAPVGQTPAMSSDHAQTIMPSRREEIPRFPPRIGHVVLSSKALDYCLVQLSSDPHFQPATRLNTGRIIPRHSFSIELDGTLSFIEHEPRETRIHMLSPSSGLTTGMLHGFSSYSRLPRSTIFQEVFIATLDKAMAPGDCGSWVRDAETGKIFGHVVGGSTSTAMAMVMPARDVFQDILSAFQARTISQAVQPTTTCSTTESSRSCLNARSAQVASAAEHFGNVLPPPGTAISAVQAAPLLPPSSDASHNHESQNADISTVTADSGRESQAPLSDFDYGHNSECSGARPIANITPPSSVAGDDVMQMDMADIYSGTLEHSQGPSSGGTPTFSHADGGISAVKSASDCANDIEHTQDDTAVPWEPLPQVDYLSHDWEEEDIWSSWRYIISRKRELPASTRLENASWRAWTKTNNNLATISPGELNWHKDCDVTWLFGPLVSCSTRAYLAQIESSSQKSGSQMASKSTLPKMGVKSVEILRRSRTTAWLLEQPTTVIPVQETMQSAEHPNNLRLTSDYCIMLPPSTREVSDGSAVRAPTTHADGDSSQCPKEKHIHLNEDVEQYIATEVGRGKDSESSGGATPTFAAQTHRFQSASIRPDASQCSSFLAGTRPSPPRSREETVGEPHGASLSLVASALDNMPKVGRKPGHVRSAIESTITAPGSADNSVMGSEEDTDEGFRYKPEMVRKKSGELVRPALRASRRRPTGMPGTSFFSKAVHFDSHLEHIRYFLQVDRPFAVSAGSSPVETYESDGEYPFPGNGKHNVRMPPFEWELVTANFPPDSHHRRMMPARLEKVWLSVDQKSLLGSIAVANLAFHKQVACRFTLDYWQTVSEVAAEYSHEIRPRETPMGYDRFTFSIKLSDLANLEAKTLFFCIRYSVNDQEFWDNNNSTNFQVDFRKKHLPQNGTNSFGGAASRPVNDLPRSRNRRHNSPSTLRPVSMPVSLDAFGSEPNKLALDHPIHEYLGESGLLRLQTKSTSNLARDNIASNLKSPNGVAFSNRYDFGASLNAALRVAKDSAAKDRDTLYTERNVRDFGPTLGVPDAATSPSSSSDNSRNRSLSPSPSPRVSYEELVNKYCFFGSTKSRPTLQDDAVKLVTVGKSINVAKNPTSSECKDGISALHHSVRLHNQRACLPFLMMTPASAHPAMQTLVSIGPKDEQSTAW